MCSIFGFNFDDRGLLKRMAKILEHRGPEVRGYYNDENVSLGHCRLKIIDLSENAKQPMSNENESIWITFNGEIYNFRELRKELEGKHEFKSNSDTEAIIHCYEEYGINFLEKLRGIFALCIYDAEKKILILARDRVGVKPLYYYFNGEKFIFASEPKGILQEVKPKLDLVALDEFFTFQFTLAPRTLFQGIKKLHPAHFLTFDLKSGKITEKKYWELSLSAKEKPQEYYIKKIEEKIKESVKLRLISDVPLGIYLSGGLDSSYVAAIAKELSEEIRAYTIAFGYENDEVEYARITAEHLDIEHKVIEVSPKEIELLPRVTWHLDKPCVDIAAVPLYIMAKVSKRYLTVALLGDGGDELFAGYDKYKLMVLREYYRKFPKFARYFGIHLISLFLKKETAFRLKKFNTDDDVEAYLAYASTFTEEEKSKLYRQIPLYATKEKLREYFSLHEPILQRLLYLDLKTLLPNDYLMKVDKATMANAVEARVPYLDHEFVELAFSIPSRYKIKRLQTKHIFRKAISRKLPREIVKRKKHGFDLPTEKWLKEGLREIALQLFDSSPEIINKEFCKKILQNFNRNKRYYNRQFWACFSFILWYKMYFEVEKPKFNIDYYL
ncbi:MAG: asparagine synthase (glutamine-hydrolyzing) [Candidatus Hydrothermarchaeota archaeon]|nr:MAG: asparagine synthase (glutamine-hydrolyzing) [Candidatus Hydrothermarchaeota archaeon]